MNNDKYFVKFFDGTQMFHVVTKNMGTFKTHAKFKRKKLADEDCESRNKKPQS